MQQIIVGTKYQIVIPKEVREKIKGIKPGAKVMVKQEDKNTSIIKTPKKTWSDQSYGFMKEAWKGVNPIIEIEKMRNEWDEKRT